MPIHKHAAVDATHVVTKHLRLLPDGLMSVRGLRDVLLGLRDVLLGLAAGVGAHSGHRALVGDTALSGQSRADPANCEEVGC